MAQGKIRSLNSLRTGKIRRGDCPPPTPRARPPDLPVRVPPTGLPARLARPPDLPVRIELRARQRQRRWPLGVSSDVPRGFAGGFLGGGGLEGALAAPRVSWSVLGASEEPLGASWSLLGGHSGASRWPPGASSAPFGGPFGGLAGFLGAIWDGGRSKRKGGLKLSKRFDAPIKALLAPHIGALAERSRALLGQYWGLLGLLLGLPGAFLEPS